MRFLPVLSMVAAGICVSIQGPVNARLRLAVGSPTLALGTTFVLGSIIAIPQAGAVVVICSGIVGQMIGSYLIDTFGCLGVDKVPFS
jgi:uncharacterized membrane protein YdcZ (DUF606 family)